MALNHLLLILVKPPGISYNTTNGCGYKPGLYEVIPLFILFFLLWIILNGRFTLEIGVFGILISLIISLFSARVLGAGRRIDVFLFRNLPILFAYSAVLIFEILKSAVFVSLIALNPKKRPEPCLIEFDSGLDTGFKNVLLANSITLTPGTYTVFQEGDHFVVHCLTPGSAADIGDSVFVRLLRKMRT